MSSDLSVSYVSCLAWVSRVCAAEKECFAEVGGVPDQEAEVCSDRICDLYGLVRLRIKTLLVAVLDLYELQVTRYLC